jgi:ABC-2 type transport system permease protein
MRSVFLPDSFATQEVAQSWEHGKTAIILTTWLVAGFFIALKTFRWERS